MGYAVWQHLPLPNLEFWGGGYEPPPVPEAPFVIILRSLYRKGWGEMKTIAGTFSSLVFGGRVAKTGEVDGRQNVISDPLVSLTLWVKSPHPSNVCSHHWKENLLGLG